MACLLIKLTHTEPNRLDVTYIREHRWLENSQHIQRLQMPDAEIAPFMDLWVNGKRADRELVASWLSTPLGKLLYYKNWVDTHQEMLTVHS